jgi:periplasmic protein TonB
MSRVHPESQPLTRRTVVAGAVTGLHAVFAVGLLVSTAIHLGATPPPSIRLVDIKPDDVVQPKVPPPPPFGFKPGDVTAPPDPDIRVIGPDGGQAIVVAGAMPVVPVHAQPQAEPAAVTPVQFTRTGRQTLMDVCGARYPSVSRRLNEEGVVRLLVYVAADGHAAETRVETSSGYPRLDEANVACIREAGRVFTPQLAGQTPTGAWQSMSYRWVLGN